MSLLLLLLIILLLFGVFGGGWGYSRYGYGAWSPLLIILIVFIVLYFSGALASL